MKPIVIVCRGDSFYAREVVRVLGERGHPPHSALVGSNVENLLFNLRSLRRIWSQLGFIETVRRIRRTRRAPAPQGSGTPLAEQAREHGFTIRRYDCVNSGGMIVDILEVPDAVVILAGCGMVDRAVIHAARGGCVNGHPALLPGVRGVDVVEWALVQGRPLGVTAHHVAPAVDSGEIVKREAVSPERGESYDSYNHRLVLVQARVLAEAALLIASGEDERLPNPLEEGVLVRAAPASVHKRARAAFEATGAPMERGTETVREV